MDMTTALATAIGALSSAVVYLVLENKRIQEARIEEMRHITEAAQALKQTAELLDKFTCPIKGNTDGK